MNKLCYKAMIEDVKNEKCTDAEMEALLDAFEYTIKRMTSLANKAWYDLKDYVTSKQKGIDQFTLIVERKNVLGQRQWHGVFEHDNKRLSVIGTLEK